MRYSKHRHRPKSVPGKNCRQPRQTKRARHHTLRRHPQYIRPARSYGSTRHQPPLRSSAQPSGHIHTARLSGGAYGKAQKEVFKSIAGYYWYLRLRGYEIDAEQFRTRSFGNDYAVGDKTADPEKIAKLIMKLCEKTGRRLRQHGYQANGIFLGLGFENHSWWGKSRRLPAAAYSTQELYLNIMRLLGW
ncbi:hypothetical protein IPL68_05390 [Candidatus Saccharibacteria bacterium]|nr:MAG: hypothetical protein IPL68_05390 [Candidatus Saccharibacteria bacterium]